MKPSDDRPALRKYRAVAFWLMLMLHVVRPPVSGAQSEIPLGQWRTHFSYQSITRIAASEAYVFGSAGSAIMILDKNDFSTSSLTGLNGLSGGDISALAAHGANQLFVGYADGQLDVVEGSAVFPFDGLKTSAISSSKTINHIAFHDNLVYLSTDFGVVVFDPAQRQVRETWRNLGEAGELLRITKCVFLDDLVFLATENGVISGLLADNLLDYANWTRYDEGVFNTEVQSVETFNGTVYAALTPTGLFRFGDGVWYQEDFLQNSTFNTLSSSTSQLLISEGDRLWSLSPANALTPVSSPVLNTPFDVDADDAGRIWVGDSGAGIVLIEPNASQSFVLNGPAFTSPFRLTFIDDKLYACKGGFAATGQALNNAGRVSIFSAGIWTTESAPSADVTAIVPAENHFAVSSFGDGVQTGPVAAPDIQYNEANSTLLSANTPTGNVLVTDLAVDGDRLWAANYNVPAPLHLFQAGQWQSFAFPVFAARFPVILAVDINGSVWMALNPSQGGGIMVYDPEGGRTAYLSEQANVGGLPDRSVYALATARDGSVWVGTGKGIAYFPSPSSVFSNNVNAVRPIFENRFLFADERITALHIDGGNRKWVGTGRGAWLFNPTADELIHRFSTNNSPLPSDEIQQVAVHPSTGEVFFATAKGLVSYRSDATRSQETFERVKIFPNPITPSYSGLVGISGLATDAVVKITEINGKLVWQTQANGGTATWNLQNGKGSRVSTGIYLVFSANADGSERFVGKIAVVE